MQLSIFNAAEVQCGGSLCAGTRALCRLQLVTKDDSISVVELCGSGFAHLWF